MQIRNDTNATITVAQVYSIPPGATVDVPWEYIRTDEAAFQSLIAGGLTAVTPPEIDWSEAHPVYQGMWIPATTLAAGSPETNFPNTLFVGPFREGRIHISTTSGGGQFRIQSSPDGGITWFEVPDLQPVTLSVGQTSFPVPSGCMLLRAVLSPNTTAGWSGTCFYTLKA